MTRPVIIVDYEPQWPIIFEEEKAKILDVIGHKVVAIEHIGSTSVPGLGAKPIIDMIAGVRDLAEAKECVSLLQRHLGYIDITPELGHSEWFYCIGNKMKPEEKNTIHLHLVKYNSNHWKKHLLFRDFLRANPDATQQYYKLKKELAEKYGTDREAYTDGKASFIEFVISQAGAVD
ncbi:MAG: GrpB family protein [Candidatus Thorarchaeota archaeon]|jgi:GrpB-like predicted nucleotidyltransferase (UPF0157 family)